MIIAFYSSALSYNDKTGYLEINEINDKYFIEMMFHYAKVETYIEKRFTEGSSFFHFDDFRKYRL